MPVTLGKHGDYAVRAALDLARHWEEAPRKAREIADSMDIRLDFLKRILAKLVAQGLLASTAGPNGGYRLTQPPRTSPCSTSSNQPRGSVRLTGASSGAAPATGPTPAPSTTPG